VKEVFPIDKFKWERRKLKKGKKKHSGKIGGDRVLTW
jgi:hypothetical protein